MKPVFTNINHRIQVRFNQEHSKTPGLFWRLIVDEVEYKVRSIVFKAEMTTEEFELEGVMKGNVVCYGRPVFDHQQNVTVYPQATSRFHVISLQRTASKALVNALNQVAADSPGYLNVDQQPLGEFLHNWGINSYTFAPHLDWPFGHDEDVVYFKSHPKYRQQGTVQFRTDFDEGAGNFIWTKTKVMPVMPSMFYAQAALADLMEFGPNRSWAIKTQLASLIHNQDKDSVEDFLSRLQDFQKKNNVFTIHLTRSNVLDWVCSMLVTEATGIFIANTTQATSIEYLKKNPIVFWQERVRELAHIWKAHEALGSMADLAINDRVISEGFEFTDHNQALVKVPPQPHVKEYSVVDYAELIHDHEGLKLVVADAFGVEVK